MQQISSCHKQNKYNKIPMTSWPASVPPHTRAKNKRVQTELARFTFLLIYIGTNKTRPISSMPHILYSHPHIKKWVMTLENQNCKFHIQNIVTDSLHKH